MPSQEAPPTGISVEDWAATPPSVRAWARTVEQRLARLEERLKQGIVNLMEHSLT
jgi:hypothetical protein